MSVGPVTFRLDEDAVGWIVFDAAGARPNVFDAATQQALAAALDEALAATPRAIVVASAKERIFIAGADLRWLQSLPSTAAATEFSRAGQALFQRLANLRMPVVCAINGACAGGGYELALACDWRTASEGGATLIGLPETGIGTIPGWGGCARLPRLIGAERAVEHIVRAMLIPAADAQAAGLIDEVVSPADLRSRAKAAALRLARDGKPARKTVAHPPEPFFAQARTAVLAKARGYRPSAIAAIDAIEEGLSQSLDRALQIEADRFGEVTSTATCKHLIHVFFLREAARKRTLDGWFPQQSLMTPPIYRVGVVGAGVMGSGIAHWLATRGFDVVLRDVQVEFIERALGVVRALLDVGVKRGKSTSEEAAIVFGRIRTTTSWEGFAACDLVIEAIVENVAAKRQLFADLSAVVRPDAVLASNTSALPIDEIAGHIPNPERALGIHFFNPVSRMPLVELVIGGHTSGDTAARALALIRKLGKSPVVCRSSPGFVVTRVLFFYLNAAVELWESGQATEAIDAAMRDFGWPMGPLRLIDEVGVDVTAFIFREMAEYFRDRFRPTNACERLVAGGLVGRKNGASCGFYRYESGKEPSNDAETRALAASPQASGVAPSNMPAAAIVVRLMAVMVEEAQRCVDERVVLSADDVDFALLSGAGFPAFRGGLLRWAAAGK